MSHVGFHHRHQNAVPLALEVSPAGLADMDSWGVPGWDPLHWPALRWPVDTASVPQIEFPFSLCHKEDRTFQATGMLGWFRKLQGVVTNEIWGNVTSISSGQRKHHGFPMSSSSCHSNLGDQMYRWCACKFDTSLSLCKADTLPPETHTPWPPHVRYTG